MNTNPSVAATSFPSLDRIYDLPAICRQKVPNFSLDEGGAEKTLLFLEEQDKAYKTWQKNKSHLSEEMNTETRRSMDDLKIDILRLGEHKKKNLIISIPLKNGFFFAYP